MAAPGDEISVYVATFPIPNGVMCIRLGELAFHVMQQD
jgi:hypothetical protein